MFATRGLIFTGALLASTAWGDTTFFAEHVAPVLKERCLSCHNAEQGKGGLRLHTAEALLAGEVVSAGNPQSSALFQRITSTDPDERMPPKGAALNAAQIAAIEQWITAGAPWDQAAMDAPHKLGSTHWAYQSPKQGAIPDAGNDWAQNPIDQFLLARMTAAGLQPSPEAERRALIRRLSLDLIGLPPTPEEVAAFTADSSADAYEKLVDRLLASPHYGERMAVRWLDIAHYADTNGYEKDRTRPMWPYRDWVINAYNKDLPFDEFVVEQVAGDLLPNATQDQRIATGFLRNSLYNEEGGVDVEEFRFEAMVDRVATTATAFLGMTLACAQCHDHKYDPVSQREYYAFFAFLNNTENATMKLHAPAIAEQRAAKEAEIASLRSGLADAFPLADAITTDESEAERRARNLSEKLAVWITEQQPKCSDWSVLDPIEYSSAKTATLRKLEDKSVLVTGECPNTDTYTVAFRSEMATLTGLRLEALTHESLPGEGPGRGMIMSPDGDFFLSEVRVFAAPWNAPDQKQRVALGAPTASFAAAGHEVAHALDGLVDTGWSVNGGQGKDHRAVFSFAEPLPAFDGGTLLTVELEHFYVHQHTLGRFRISATGDNGSPEATSLPADVEAALATSADQWSAPVVEQVKQHYLSVAPELAESHAKIEELRKALPKYPEQLVLAERDTPRPTHLHHRGIYLNPREPVGPDTPEALHPFPDAWPRNRLSFARWLVAGENPLFARVTVNRTWQMLFGRGLVETTEDFGLMASPPTHPELLDWLSVEFQRRGYSTKELLRLMVTSAAYRQQAVDTPALLAADPRNDLLARAPRFRLDAELLRDAMLASSGLLSPKAGGPGVYPPVPKEALSAIYGGSANVWPDSTGEDRFRRGVYTFIKRILPYPSATTFDMPTRDVVCTRRMESNTPLQALTLLNNSEFVVAAQALAARVLREEPNDSATRLRRVFELALSRAPDATEADALKTFLRAQRKRFASGEMDPAPLVGDYTVESATPAEQAAWVALCRVVLNLDEALSRT